MKKLKNKRGSYTMEAALVLPVIIFVVITVVLIMMFFLQQDDRKELYAHCIEK